MKASCVRNRNKLEISKYHTKSKNESQLQKDESASKLLDGHEKS